MAPLTERKLITRREANHFGFPAAANAKVQEGSLVVLDATWAKAGATAQNLVAVGIATEFVDNTGGGNGAKMIPVEKGTFLFANAGGVTRAHIGGQAFIVDDQTVAHDNGTNTRSGFGRIEDVDSAGVWVKIL
ncbi:hypothetical protein [Taklimakanibacter albus]|uniref:Uncharacterized protein n=1 Tax=Taklimakanibacter albus TaxID=2800327 RepID=A0ACC5R6Q8_9HYPH|nr:hypothetical protein [Aestuariivirga sp. YIM B02566]MBK1868262.1 hypothetical protein [Aestuariivirga sp. YIM B02566]